MGAVRGITQVLKENRGSRRWLLAVPGRITWRDSRGATRFASVVTRDVSETGVYIEWNEPSRIPLFRLVSFQIEREVRDVEGLPAALRSGKVLSAVYRIGSHRHTTGTPDGYALRLLVDPQASRIPAASTASLRGSATA